MFPSEISHYQQLARYGCNAESKIDANAYFDDFYVEQYYKAPSLPTSKVKVYDSNNEVVENWNSIPSDISSISLDFSTPMKSSSFTTDTVKLTKHL